MLIGVSKWRRTNFFVLGSYRGSKLAPLALSTRCGLSGSKLSRKKNKRIFFLVKEAQLKQVPVLLFFYRSLFGDLTDKNTLKVPLFRGLGGLSNPKAPLVGVARAVEPLSTQILQPIT